jgi:hypothetical protein
MLFHLLIVYIGVESISLKVQATTCNLPCPLKTPKDLVFVLDHSGTVSGYEFRRMRSIFVELTIGFINEV